jgi:hypothetical protein
MFPEYNLTSQANTVCEDCLDSATNEAQIYTLNVQTDADSRRAAIYAYVSIAHPALHVPKS